MKKSQILAIFLAIIAAISVVVFFITKKAEEPEVTEVADTDFHLTASDYSAKIRPAGDGGKIFLPSAVPGYYFTADLKNNVEFWKLSVNGFSAATEPVRKAKVNLYASNQTIPVTVSYIEAGGENIGAGVFTSDMNGSVKYYDYAFVELRKMPAGYGSGYLLLADYTKEDIYRADKVYNDIFEYNMSSPSVSVKVSQNTRLVDSDATYRQDWDMLTDEFISNLGSAKYFMSSRYYTGEETGKRTDIMEYSSNYRPKIVAKDIVGDWFVNDGKGMHYLVKTDKGFKCVTVKDKKTTTDKEFELDYFTGCLRSGNWLFSKESGQVYNLLTGDTAEFKGADFTQADVFSISPDGTKAVIAFYGEANANGVPVQKLVYAETGGNKAEVYTEPLLFAEESGFIWLDPLSVMSVRAADDSGENAGSVIYTFTAE